MPASTDHNLNKLLIDKLEKQVIVEKSRAEKFRHAHRELLTRLSHEFNTPLHTIIGYAELLTSHSKLDSDEHELLAEILDTARFLNKQNVQFLELADVQSKEVILTAVSVAEIIDDCITMLERNLKKKSVELLIDTDLSEIMVLASYEPLKKVVYNLLFNAIKYSHTQDKVNLSVSELGETVKVLVKDYGEGIPAEISDSVFSLFHDRDVEVVQNFEIGLYLAKEYMDLMNGTIDFESVEGEGTSFWIQLPTAVNKPELVT